MRTQKLGRRAATLASVLALAAGAAACGEDEEEPAAGGGSGGAAATEQPAEAEQIGKGLTIGFVPATNCANETVCNVGKGVEAQAKAMGAEVTVLENNPADPVNDAIKNMDQLIAQKVDAIAIWPLDPGAMKAPTRRAERAGIPVFAHDLYDTEDSGVVASVTQGRELKAKQAAERICAAHPDGGEMLYGDLGLPAPTLIFLREKFTSYLEQCSGGKMKIVGDFTNKNDDVATARGTAESALQKHRDVVAIDSYNDPTSIGASQAADSLGLRENLTISGYNLAKNGVDALTAGRIDVSWDYRPVVVGQILGRTMVEYAAKKNEQPAKITMVWPKCYTRDTIGDLPTVDEQLADIAAGKDLAEADPELQQTGDTIPEPADSLPGCPE
jgi:ABC-type sugar transport system substrate-binding protein